MTAAHDLHAEQHEELLHAHLAGDVPAEDARLVRRLESCATCRERLLELSSLTDLLERIGGEQRRHLAPTAAPAPGADRVTATLQALAQGRPAPHLRPVPAPRGSPALWRVGLAAAAVLVAGWVVKSLLPPASEPREDVLLGDGVDHSVTPSGTVDSFETFVWPTAPADAAFIQLQVWKQGQEFAGMPMVDERLERFPWTPSPEQLAQLEAAGAVHWEAIAFDAAGVQIDDCTSNAVLRSAD